MDLLTTVLFVAGVFLLIFGADLLVRGASQLAAGAGVPALIIGLTVVAAGTSSPELAVSLQAALGGQGDITLGNVIGSNIANVLLILGVAALIGALPVAREIMRRDLPVMIGASLALLLLGLDGLLSRLDGLLLLGGLFGYGVATIRAARRGAARAEGPRPERLRPIQWLSNLALLAGGLALLVTGADWLVAGAIAFAAALGVGELVIGLTVVAVGTSLPEIATSVIAGLRGERDIAVGNVVGSNIMNLLFVLSLTVLIDPDGILVPGSALRLDIPVMIGAALICLPIFITRGAVTRREAGLLLAYYLIYTGYLVLSAVAFGGLSLYALTALVFVPITAVALMVRALRYLAVQNSA